MCINSYLYENYSLYRGYYLGIQILLNLLNKFGNRGQIQVYDEHFLTFIKQVLHYLIVNLLKMVQFDEGQHFHIKNNCYAFIA